MGTARTDHTATLLGDGHVLVTGGVGPDGRPQPTAEVFLAGRGPLVSITPTSLTFATKLVGTTSGPRTYRVENLGSSPLAVSGIVVSGAHPSDFGASTDCTAGPLLPERRARCPPRSRRLRRGSEPQSWRSPTTRRESAGSNGRRLRLRSGRVGADGTACRCARQRHRNAPSQRRRADRRGSERPGEQPLVASRAVRPRDARVHDHRFAQHRPRQRDGNAAGRRRRPRRRRQGANFANLTSAELYDPATGTWSTTGAMNDFGYAMTSTLLPNGKVLVVGLGFGATAEVYDPASGTWSDTGPMTASHFYATANLLKPARCSWPAAGRRPPSCTTRRRMPGPRPVRCTSPANGTRPRAWQRSRARGRRLSARRRRLRWPARSSTTRAPDVDAHRFDEHRPLRPRGDTAHRRPRHGHRRVHRVLRQGQVVATTEFYSPGDGYWLSAPSMTAPRYEHTATLLANGDVLVAGGDTIECCTATRRPRSTRRPSCAPRPTTVAAGQVITCRAAASTRANP